VMVEYHMDLMFVWALALIGSSASIA
jgi:hypothetical protein